MKRISRVAAAVGAVAAAALTASPAAASAPIQPDQHFVALVNGSRSNALVRVACPGPPSKGRQGIVLHGQTLSVAERAGGAGFTGSFAQINAWIIPKQPWPAPAQAHFTRYGQQRAIPSVRVPCGGTGTVEFSSCPYLAPCPYGWTPVAVSVRFVNVAA